MTARAGRAAAVRGHALLALAAAIAAPAAARADRAGFGALGERHAAAAAGAGGGLSLDVAGALRVRGEALVNLDLDRGVTPSGAPLFPVPLADPSGQTLTTADMRLRTDWAFAAPGTGVRVVVRVDVLDNLALGSTPEGRPATGRAPTPAASPGQQPPADALRVKRAYGEAVTPLGVLAAGRMGSHWGLGMLANGGDCADCDGGDAADRIAFAAPVAGHVWAAAYDWTSTGPTARRRDAVRALDVEPTDRVNTVTFAVLRYHSDVAIARRRRAGRLTVDYGAYVSHRWQDNDVPADYLPVAQPVPIDAAQVMARGYRATAVDGWARLALPGGRVEVEAAALRARVDQASLVPGVSYPAPVDSSQFGAAVETDLWPAPGWTLGFDFGFASGDPAPGFGAFPRPLAPPATAGDIDGPQANPPFDNRVDNFRFHPDYRIDRILFREIVGTVTDAVYLKPRVAVDLVDLGRARMTLSLAAVASFAVEPSSTPSGARGLGVEIDPTIAYTSDGFAAVIEHAVLVPLAGLDNPGEGLDARTAQLWRARLEYSF